MLYRHYRQHDLFCLVVNVVKTDRTLLAYKSKPHVKVRFVVYLEITSFVKASISALRHGVEKKIVSFKPDSLLSGRTPNSWFNFCCTSLIFNAVWDMFHHRGHRGHSEVIQCTKTSDAAGFGAFFATVTTLPPPGIPNFGT